VLLKIAPHAVDAVADIDRIERSIARLAKTTNHVLYIKDIIIVED